MLTIDALKEFGADTEQGVARCFGNGDFYLNLVKTVPKEPSFEKLSAAVTEGNLDAAFEMAHALKGVLGNLSLTPIFDPVSEITELLRAKKQMDYSALLKKIEDKRAALAKLCEG